MRAYPELVIQFTKAANESYKESVLDLAAKTLEACKDKYYTYHSMMLYVAEETKSVIECDENQNQYTFTYVGV